MNGHDLERLLSLIDENSEANQARLRIEVMSFIENNEDSVVDQLREKNQARVSTSFGDFMLDLADLRNNIFSPVAA